MTPAQRAMAKLFGDDESGKTRQQEGRHNAHGQTLRSRIRPDQPATDASPTQEPPADEFDTRLARTLRAMENAADPRNALQRAVDARRQRRE